MLFGAECHHPVCALVVEGFQRHVHFRTYIKTIDRAEEEGSNIQPATFRRRVVPLEVERGEAKGSGPQVKRL